MIRCAVGVTLFWLGLGIAVGSACSPDTLRCSPSNCGGCCKGNECLPFARQSNTLCGASGALCEVCDQRYACRQGACRFSTDGVDSGEPVACGDAGQPCCDGLECTAGNECAVDECVPCGRVGGLCCVISGANPAECFGQARCIAGVCAAQDAGSGTCGDAGLPCCETSPPCSAALVCGTRGRCEEACGARDAPCCVVNDTPTCNAGLSCAGNGRCGVADAGLPDAGVKQPLGAACAVSSECQAGLYCQTLGFTGGSCTKTCTTDSTCGAGNRCGVNPNNRGGTKLCLKGCTQAGLADPTCRSGYVCDRQPLGSLDGGGGCYPRCASTSTCGGAPTCDSRGFCSGTVGFACAEGTSCAANQQCTGRHCVSVACGASSQPCCQGNVCNTGLACRNSACTACGGSNQPCCANNTCNGQNVCQTSGGNAGLCITPTPSAALGAACEVAGNCASNTCIVELPSGAFNGGYCSQPCPPTCPSGSHCSPYVVNGADTPFCFGGCGFDGGRSTCRNGYVCDKGAVPVDFNQAICVPACARASDCPTGRCELFGSAGFCCGGYDFRCCATGVACNQGVCIGGYCR